MHKTYATRPLLLLVGWILLASPMAVGFDCGWHWLITTEVIQGREFTPYSTDILILGSWGPDLFQTLYQNILGRRIEQVQGESKLALVPGLSRLMLYSKAKNSRQLTTRKAAVFLHFDNIADELDSNYKVHLLWQRLQENTVRLIVTTYEHPQWDKDTKGLIILLALGSSLHMVQDFYSHSNWIHNDFKKLGMSDCPAGRVPTYFEACRFFGLTNNETPAFPFAMEFGIYPYPTPLPFTQEGVPKTHEAMNHDNSQLCEGGLDMAIYHTAGMISARESAAGHQHLAVATAMAACHEWLLLLEQAPQVREAIEFAGHLKRRKFTAQAESRLAVESFIRANILLQKWDGPHPSIELQRVAQQSQRTHSHLLLSLLRGRNELIPNVFNRYWSVYVDFDICERLAAGLGNTQTGRYEFAKWDTAHEERPALQSLSPPQVTTASNWRNDDNLLVLLLLTLAIGLLLGLDPVGRYLERRLSR